MGRDYFVLLDGAGSVDRLQATAPRTTSQALGMRRVATCGGAIVFASEALPVLQLPGGGIVIGDLHTRNGSRVEDVTQLAWPATKGAPEVRRYVVECCWGDYLLLLPTASNGPALSVTRSPSPACDIQCVYASAGGTGFVTSDASFAVRLGLHCKRVDFDHLAHRLLYPDLKPRHTGWAGIDELLPGCTLHLGRDRMEVSQDWQPWDFVQREMRQTDPREAAASIRRAVISVVDAWTAQDASILLELSGGLDSSIVGACMKNAQSRVTCSTLTTALPGADERAYAGLVADLLGTELRATQLDYSHPRFAFPLHRALASPAVGPFQYAVDGIMAREAETIGATAAYSGAGGDTVFCYLPSAVPAADAFMAAGLAAGVRTIRDLSLFHQCTYWHAGGLALRKIFSGPALPHTVDRTWLPLRMPMPEPQRHPWFRTPDDALPGDRKRIYELSTMQFYRDSAPRGRTRRLRMPLLAQPVVEACLRAPSWMWYAGGRNRALARDAFAEILPTQILMRKSKGTFTSYLGALYRRRKDEILEFLLDGQLHAHGLLDPDALVDFTGHELPSGDDSFMRLFELCALENWARQYS